LILSFVSSLYIDPSRLLGRLAPCGKQVAEASSGRIPRPLLMRSGTRPALVVLLEVYKVKHDARTRRG
jgi:hypothetical protein